ncbi:AbrB/MazE/SpoVT family DNA-binding domain-containing protein [Vulcanisaeta distributa]|uniref:Transcriptional regulator, AbrB family n=1 Tax=Vulcanisaeta distributa (strain DSM 14429 / JCM 11212 / NBRC 100878 / IC-017) TaxID=572478 RepID=E1QPU3_VULDI|nr:AbrB/MazE/SpoVT family DNA-binding domain-containing protein [Vulcanisaeta distributa]ADN51503.1 transcriptional regulator, AbrB family [Vulcanisaeta distributa DSM 14429]
MIEETKITRNYQITIPATIRKKLGLKVGDTLIVKLEGDRIILEPKRRSITEIRIRLGRKVDWRYVEETIREVIEKG